MVPFAKYLIETKSIVKTIFQITLVPLCQNLLPIPAVLALRMLLRAQDPLKRVHDKVRRPSTYRVQLQPSRKCQKSTAAYVLGRHSAHSLLMFGVAWRTCTLF